MIIQLNKNFQTEIDDVDFERLLNYYHKDGPFQFRICDSSWFVSKNGYATTTRMVKGIRYAISMHRLIIGVKPGETTDHINHDKLNNHRRIEFILSYRDNSKIRTIITGKSCYRGVCWHKRTQQWRAQITNNNKTNHLGYFNDEIEAAKAYNKAAKRLNGEFAKLNIFITSIKKEEE